MAKTKKPYRTGATPGAIEHLARKTPPRRLLRVAFGTNGGGRRASPDGRTARSSGPSVRSGICSRGVLCSRRLCLLPRVQRLPTCGRPPTPLRFSAVSVIHRVMNAACVFQSCAVELGLAAIFAVVHLIHLSDSFELYLVGDSPSPATAFCAGSSHQPRFCVRTTGIRLGAPVFKLERRNRAPSLRPPLGHQADEHSCQFFISFRTTPFVSISTLQIGRIQTDSESVPTVAREALRDFVRQDFFARS